MEENIIESTATENTEVLTSSESGGANAGTDIEANAGADIGTSAGDWDDDWDDIDISDAEDDEFSENEPANQPAKDEKSPGTDGVDTNGADTNRADTTESAESAKTDGTESKEQTDQFVLKHLGIEKTVSRSEAIALAQKGLDYDRIRGKLSEAEAEAEKNSEAIAFVNDLAKEQNITVREVIDNAKAAKLAKTEGIDFSVALGRIANDRTKKELENERLKLQQNKNETAKASEEDLRRKADISEFMRKFPDVQDFNSIPQEVWDSVKAGESLAMAYTEYRLKISGEKIKELNSKLEAEKQNSKNKARSTGSQKTDGQKKYEDEFDRLWYED